ncbi:MAG: hypothetical protein C4K58_02320 [Flavobacteriaceae bacterium]|nr:MAG: hypothetical protein C4K58_02320 [Flavobacteriaceae bacterium]
MKIRFLVWCFFLNCFFCFGQKNKKNKYENIEISRTTNIILTLLDPFYRMVDFDSSAQAIDHLGKKKTEKSVEKFEDFLLFNTQSFQGVSVLQYQHKFSTGNPLILYLAGGEFLYGPKPYQKNYFIKLALDTQNDLWIPDLHKNSALSWEKKIQHLVDLFLLAYKDYPTIYLVADQSSSLVVIEVLKRLENTSFKPKQIVLLNPWTNLDLPQEKNLQTYWPCHLDLARVHYTLETYPFRNENSLIKLLDLVEHYQTKLEVFYAKEDLFGDQWKAFAEGSFLLSSGKIQKHTIPNAMELWLSNSFLFVESEKLQKRLVYLFDKPKN